MNAWSGRAAPGIRVGRALPRRSLLRGLGASIALPWLGAMAKPSRAGLGIVSAPVAPRRLVYVYVPNGVQRSDWKPTSASLENLPRTLAPLDGLQQRFSILSGLAQNKANANGDGPGDHARAAAAFLTGVQPLKADGQIRLARSADQVIADELEGATPIRSLALGGESERLSGQCDSGYACAYSTHISWRSSSTPAAKETSPRRLFDRLFRGGDEDISAAGRARRRSVLDFVRADAKRLARSLDGPDRDRLDAYLTGLRELEARIERSSELTGRVEDAARPGGPPDGYQERVEQLYELLGLALEHDAARVATFLVANEGSNRSFPELGIRDGHHGLSHHRGNGEWIAALQRIEQHHVELFAAFLRRLAETEEGGQDVLANTAVVYGSGIGDGDQHDHEDLPVLFAGDLRGITDTGQHVEYPEATPMNDLHLSLLRRFGVDSESFGDSHGCLGEA